MGEWLGFKIWYADNSTFDSTQGSWIDAPDQGVQAVNVFLVGKDTLNRPQRVLLTGKDYYCYDPDLNEFYATNKLSDAKNAKIGTNIDILKFAEIKRLSDRDFGAITLNIRISTADFDLGKDG